MNMSPWQAHEAVAPVMEQIIRDQFEKLVADKEKAPNTTFIRVPEPPENAEHLAVILDWEEEAPNALEGQHYGWLKKVAQRAGRKMWLSLAYGNAPRSDHPYNPDEWPRQTATISPLTIERGEKSSALNCHLYIKRDIKEETTNV